MKIDGLPVVDAKAAIKLIITAGDIRRGKGGNPDTCAAAIACMRQLDCRAAKVHMGRIYVLSRKKWYRYDTPQSIRSEIIAFDRRHSFKPGIYKLRPPRPSDVAVRGKQKGSKTNQSARLKSRKRIAPHFVEGVRGRMHDYENAKSKS
jgi:hypothetical protein